MSFIRRLVLDVMKPHEPNIIVMSEHLARLESVEAVNIVVIEIDKSVENCKVTIEGKKLDYEIIVNEIKALAGAIHSIDQVVSGNKLIEEAPVPSD